MAKRDEGPLRTVGWGPFALPGERRRLKAAEERRLAEFAADAQSIAAMGETYPPPPPGPPPQSASSTTPYRPGFDDPLDAANDYNRRALPLADSAAAIIAALLRGELDPGSAGQELLSLSALIHNMVVSGPDTTPYPAAKIDLGVEVLRRIGSNLQSDARDSAARPPANQSRTNGPKDDEGHRRGGAA